MKKTIKKVSAFLLLMIMVFGLVIRPNIASAQDDDYYVLELPTNVLDFNVAYAHYKVRDAAIVSMLMEFTGEDNILYSSDHHTPLLEYIGDKDDSMGFRLCDGVTEDDLIIDIPNKTRQEIIEIFGFDLFDGHSQLKIVLNEINDPYEIKDDTLELDLSNVTDVTSMNAMDYLIMNSLFQPNFEYFDIKEFVLYKNANGKTLIKRYERDYNKYYEYGNDLTSDDNIVIDISNDRYAYNDISGINVTTEDKIVLEFVEAEYDDSYYVIDFTTLDKLSYNNFTKVWDGLKKYDLVDSVSNVIECYKDGELLLSFSADTEAELAQFTYRKNFEIKDNTFIDVTNDELVQGILSEGFGISGVKNLSFIFKKDIQLVDLEAARPIFIKSVDPVKFELDLDWDTYKDDLKIYDKDGNVLTKDQDYTLSKGSIIVTLTDEYIDKIGTGDHSLIASLNGATITLPFTIGTTSTTVNDNEPESEDKTENTTETNKQEIDDKKTETVEKTVLGTKASEEKVETTAEKTNTSNPKTLDNVFQMFGLLIASVGGIYIASRKIKKTNN